MELEIKARRRNKLDTKKVHNVDDSDESTDDVVYAMWSTSAQDRVDAFVVELAIDGKPIKMELDTGASISVMGEDPFRRQHPKLRTEGSRVLLRSYSGELVSVEGKRLARYRDRDLPLFIVNGKGPTLLGRTWMKELLVPLPQWEQVSAMSVQDVVPRHAALFKGELGECTSEDFHSFHSVTRYCN
ncbi:uncharacterized protein LOC135392243 [Ornithodoros turicata]|uniref:uncharacterized protein LOC135392243 n=1 Tax=Ornithodoros turicata TaxID=34597 RepID=UPI00313960CA